MPPPRPSATEDERVPASTTCGPLEAWERQWLALGRRRHLAALAIVAIAALALYQGTLRRQGAHADETIYVQAAALVEAGRSPFQIPGYYYPAAFAYAWAATERLTGPIPAYHLWRLANLSAAVLLVWLSAAHLSTPPRGWWRSALLTAALLAIPGVSLALRTGNLSVLTALAVAAGVLLAGSRWITAGILLGLSVAIKPFALPALVALATPRRLERRDRPSLRWLGPEQRAGALGLGLAAVVLLAFPYTRELLQQPVETLSTIRTVSFERLFRLLGVPLPRFVVLVLVYSALAAAALVLTRTRTERATVALAGAMVAAPLVWSHTMILGLPMLTAALALYVPDLLQAPDPGEGGAAQAEPARHERLIAFAVVALVALQLFLQPGGFDHHARGLQIAFALPMLAAPPITAALVVQKARRRGPGSRRADSRV